MTIQEIIKSGSTIEKKQLFAFTDESDPKEIMLKFNLWIRYFWLKYLSSNDAPFHQDIDLGNIAIYLGDKKSFVDIAFRGAAKTARTKLFLAFAICNDTSHYRKYIKILSADGDNSKQISTDIYNMLVNQRVVEMYPEVFEKTDTKREERMSSFTTTTGVKVVAGTVGTEQRGAIQEEARPDFIWYEDFENRVTLRSAVKTIAIWDNMEEARTGLSKDGACVYTCNYISEQGNVHKLVVKESSTKILLIVPIISKEGVPAWDRYSLRDIEQMRADDEDFEGERLCEPSASKTVYFDRETLDSQKVRQPIRTSAEFKIFYKYDPSHMYGSGHDIGGGVGLDASASVFIDFTTVPARVVGTFADNTIKPEAFGDEIFRQQEMFGGCIAGIENNYGGEAILRMKQLGGNMYHEQQKDAMIEKPLKDMKFGWNTNALTKPKMLGALQKALEAGHIAVNDVALLLEVKGYTRNDLIEWIRDPRLTTRHFDLLMALAIAWQMKDFARIDNKPKPIKEIPFEVESDYYNS